MLFINPITRWTEYFKILDRQAVSDEKMKTILLQGAPVSSSTLTSIEAKCKAHPVLYHLYHVALVVKPASS